MRETVVDAGQAITQPISLGFGALVIFGIPLDDIIKILTFILITLNIIWFGVKFYDRFTGKSLGDDDG